MAGRAGKKQQQQTLKPSECAVFLDGWRRILFMIQLNVIKQFYSFSNKTERNVKKKKEAK